MRAEKARQIMTVLKELAKRSNALGLNDLRMIVALERVVARIESNTELAKNLIFKGGFVLLKNAHSNRFTRDIDALARDISHEQILNAVKKAFVLDLNDGVWFGDIKTRDLGRDFPYPGFRFDAAFQIGDPPDDERKIKKLSRIHLDVGFGDYIQSFKRQIMPSILSGSEPISWSVYPLEQIVAEKIHALIVREAGNSRAKDIYDLVLLFRHDLLDEKNLPALIASTFKARRTEIPYPIYLNIETMDLTILRSAWRSLEIMGAAGDFDEFWQELLGYLRRI